VKAIQSKSATRCKFEEYGDLTAFPIPTKSATKNAAKSAETKAIQNTTELV